MPTEARRLGRLKQAQTIRGTGNPHWKGGQTTKYCVRCSSPFLVYPSTSTRTHCSLVCANRDMADAQRGIVNPKTIHYGESNGNWKGGLGTYVCEWCNSEFEAQPSATHRFCSRTCNARWLFTGEHNHNWKGGITSESEKIRKSDEFIEWRRLVYEHDNYTCQTCGKHGGELNAHHIKAFAEFPELRLDIDNGTTLCIDCHRRTFTTPLAYRTKLQ